MAASQGNMLTRRVGPAPVWGWLVAGVVVWYVWRHLQPQSATATQTPSSVGTNGGGGASSPASGGGSSADNLNADLLNLLGFESQSLVDVNTNLTTALMNSQNAIEGMGTTALEQEGAIAQQALAVLASGGAGSSGGGTRGGGSAPPPSGFFVPAWTDNPDRKTTVTMVNGTPLTATVGSTTFFSSSTGEPVGSVPYWSY